MTEQIDYLTHLGAESRRFVEVLAAAPADAQVPSCPEWNTDDLLWHLAEVQWFWATVVREAVSDPSGIQHPDRPGDRAELLAFFQSASRDLQESLASTEPTATRWTWSKEQTAGFIRRRQAHEALVHRVDAELAADVARAPMDPALSTDGIDEALRVMYGGCPDWGTITPEDGSTLRIEAEDTGASWLVTMARFTGTDPDGTSYDEPDIAVAESDDGRPAKATVRGTAGDLDCWLWGRPTLGEPERFGDEHIHARFQQILDQGIE